MRRRTREEGREDRIKCRALQCEIDTLYPRKYISIVFTYFAKYILDKTLNLLQ